MDSDSGVELKDMGWPPVVITRDGIEVSATCTIAELAEVSIPPEWSAAARLVAVCVDALAPLEISARWRPWAATSARRRRPAR